MDHIDLKRALFQASTRLARPHLQVATLSDLYGLKNGTMWIPVVEENCPVWIARSSIWCDTFCKILGGNVDISWKDIVPFLHCLSFSNASLIISAPCTPLSFFLIKTGKFQGTSRQTLVSSCRALVGHSWASLARGCHCQLQGNLQRHSSQAHVTGALEFYRTIFIYIYI